MICTSFWSACFVMPLFRRKKKMTDEERKKLERKLYIARESPDPVFDLSDCGLDEVPKGIFSICKVYLKDQLILEKNSLKSLENGGVVSDLSLLNILNLRSNNFKTLPNSIGLLASLKELYLDDNSITHLPLEIGELVNLKKLTMSNNKLKQLPKSIGKLKSLQYINISNNSELTYLCEEICQARNLVCIELDSDKVIEPPYQVTVNGTECIMKYFCEKMQIEYIPPVKEFNDCDPKEYSKINFEQKYQLNSKLLENDEKLYMEKEKENYELKKKRRDDILNEILNEQMHLENKIGNIQDERAKDKFRFLSDIQNEEKHLNCIIKSIIESNSKNPERYKQQIDFESREHDRLLQLFTDNQSSKLKNNDIIRGMEKILEEELQKIYKHHENKVQNDLVNYVLKEDKQLSHNLSKVLKLKDSEKFDMIQQVKQNEEIQKMAVASLLERADSQSWSLNQEIAIVANHLSKLTHLEFDKQKCKVEYNLYEISQQRVHLMTILEDLFCQQKKRQEQLYDVLREMDKQQDIETNIWLMQYQRLMDSTPQIMIDSSASLDPIFLNILLEQNVIHCLPFIIKLIATNSLDSLSEDHLCKCGISLHSDRESLLKAINSYLTTKQGCIAASAPSTSIDNSLFVPSAPEANRQNECVICMDSVSEVVFLPCAHLCCCQVCSLKDINSCPICRVDIDKKIKVIAC